MSRHFLEIDSGMTILNSIFRSHKRWCNQYTWVVHWFFKARSSTWTILKFLTSKSMPYSMQLYATFQTFLSTFELEEYSPPVKAKLQYLSFSHGENSVEKSLRKYGSKSQHFSSILTQQALRLQHDKHAHHSHGTACLPDPFGNVQTYFSHISWGSFLIGTDGHWVWIHCIHKDMCS